MKLADELVERFCYRAIRRVLVFVAVRLVLESVNDASLPR